ncbi:exopolysaccharide biosynthesis polyprenyl glycosylphosphotransferase [Dankookia sp. P2]|uniref:exopolysaccharide biosynthesis polyprenyl glycosylphosphotransferase n=1 Tax=Dankookia sp. P2 TaxID=3423955 RepID=UPI003D66B8DB
MVFRDPVGVRDVCEEKHERRRYRRACPRSSCPPCQPRSGGPASATAHRPPQRPPGRRGARCAGADRGGDHHLCGFPGRGLWQRDNPRFQVLATALAAAIRSAIRTAPASLSPPKASVYRAVAANSAAILAVAAATWLGQSQLVAPAPTLLEWLLAWLIASAAVTIGLRQGAAHLARTLTDARGIVLVGAREHSEKVARVLAAEPGEGWTLAGRVDDREPGGLDRLVDMVEKSSVSIVALTIVGENAASRIAAVCERLADQAVTICVVFEAESLVHLSPTLIRIGPFALADLAVDPHQGLAGAAKRALDIAVSATALVALAPILGAIALAIRLRSPGSALFRQWRFGLGSRPILILKFRTMYEDRCDTSGAQRTAANDDRVTRLGRILRRTSIDELPQLLNVLRGEMSLVGPRPHPLHMRVGDQYYFEAVERYRARHLVKPGITGWAQINGSRGEIDTFEKAHRRVTLDLWYLNHWSLGLDLRILFRTVIGGFASFHAD